jgi:hypothetical protein
MGVRRSRTPVMMMGGVVTLSAYISDECASQGLGSSWKGLSKKL